MSMSDTQSEDDFVEEEAPEGQTPTVDMDEELSSYSENVKKRIDREVAARREAERRAEAAQREAQEKEEYLNRAAHIIKGMASENEELKKRQVETDGMVMTSLVGTLQAELDLAKQEFKKAHEEGDSEKIAEATARVAATAADLRRAEIASKAPRQPAPVQPGPNAEPPPRQAPKAAPKAVEWIRKNSEWFGKDPEKTKVARAADAFVAAMGFDPNGDDYYKEVDKVIAQRLNADNGGQSRDPRPSSQSVSPTGRSAAPAKQATKVTLNERQQGIARRLGLTNEQYASALARDGVPL